MGGLELLKYTIGRRKAFSNAAAAGRSVAEYQPKDTKAIEELNRLVQAVYHNNSGAV
jgi:chromosome partitioning protein